MDDIGTSIPVLDEPEPEERADSTPEKARTTRKEARLRGATSFKLPRWRRARIKLIY